MNQPNEPDLRDIIDNQSINTRFQSIVSLREKGLIGVEALSYSVVPGTDRIVPPVWLFEQAGRNGLRLELDRLCRSCSLNNFTRLFPQRNGVLLWLNYDTSVLRRELLGSGVLLQSVLGVGLKPHEVVIEIIESRVRDSAVLNDFVDEYKDHGFFIALDDVGTGHSNLERIAVLKPDIIKIDRSLIQNMHQEYHKQEVVRSLWNLASGIGALVVAEGIETEDEAMAVMDMGINIHQGYLYAHPDQLFDDQRASCLRKMEELAAMYRKRRMERFSARKNFYDALGGSVSVIAEHLATARNGELEALMSRVVSETPDLECLYVLDEEGIQITETHCNYSKLLRPNTPLFRPAPKGTDLSLKDYYLLIKAGLKRYVSDPYISRASGNLCVTVSQEYKAANGRSLVMCVDYDCENLTTGRQDHC